MSQITQTTDVLSQRTIEAQPVVFRAPGGPQTPSTRSELAVLDQSQREVEARPLVVVGPRQPVLADALGELFLPGGQRLGAFDIQAGQPLFFGITGVTVSRASANAASDAVYQAVYTATVPGGVMGPNGQFYFVGTIGQTNSASTKAYRLDVNGQQMSQEFTLSTSAALTKLELPWWNKGSEQANEVIFGGAPLGGATTVGVTARAIDTTQDMTVQLMVRWTAPVAGETISLLKGNIMIVPGL